MLENRFFIVGIFNFLLVLKLFQRGSGFTMQENLFASWCHEFSFLLPHALSDILICKILKILEKIIKEIQSFAPKVSLVPNEEDI